MEPPVGRQKSELDNRHQGRETGQSIRELVSQSARHGPVRHSRHGRRCRFDCEGWKQSRGKTGPEEESVEHDGPQQEPTDDADPERQLGKSCQLDPGSRERTDQPAGDGRQEVARVGRVRLEVSDDPLPHEPCPNTQGCHKEHHDERPPGLEGKPSEYQRKNHSGDWGSCHKRPEYRVAQVAGDLPWTLSDIGDKQANPDDRCQRVGRVRHRRR